MPDVSVVMPMRNAAGYVAEAVASVLGQTDATVELVVVDDGSTDGSAAVAERAARAFPHAALRLVPGPRRGIAAAFNAGLAAVTAEHVARCDADDLWPAGRLAEQVAWLREHRECVAVCGRFAVLSMNGEPGPELPCAGDSERDLTPALLDGQAQTHYCSFLTRRDALLKIGGCREYFESAEDLDLQFRLAGVGRVWYVPRLWYLYRLHGASVTHTQGSARREFFEAQAKAFARQRRERGWDDLERGAAAAPPEGAGEAASADQQWRGHLLGAAWARHAAGDRLGAIRLGMRACRAAPLDLQMWRGMAGLLLKPTGRGDRS